MHVLRNNLLYTHRAAILIVIKENKNNVFDIDNFELKMDSEYVSVKYCSILMNVISGIPNHITKVKWLRLLWEYI